MEHGIGEYVESVGCHSQMEDQLLPTYIKISVVVAVGLLGDDSTSSFQAWLRDTQTRIRTTRKHNKLPSQRFG